MLLHVPATRSLGFTPSNRTGGEAEYRLSVLRCAIGVGIIVLLIVASFAARALAWEDGASLFLHLTDTAVGGLVGLIVGEKGAMNPGRR